MPRLTIPAFYGELPQTDPNLLPQGYAQEAVDCNLESGALTCFHDNTEIMAGGPDAQYAYHTGTAWRILREQTNIIDAPTSNNRKYAGRYNPLNGTALTRPSIITFGSSPAGDTNRPLALPAPESAPTSVVVDTTDRELDSDDLPDPPLQQSLCVYTFVSDLGEESRPSPPSSVFERQPGTDDLTITLPSVPQAARDRGVEKFRVYVSETIFGQTQFQLLAETTSIVTTVNIAGDKASEGILPSENWDSLPDTYRGFVTMPNGIVVAHRDAASKGKELRFSEAYRPWTFPENYERLVEDNVVGLAMFGETLCVLTEGRPYLATGLTPGTIVLRKIDAQAPCLRRQSIVDLGYSAAYASPRGLVQISDDSVSVISAQLLSQKQWAALSANVNAGEWDGRYVWSFDEDGSRGTRILDMTGEQPYLQRLSIPARAWIYRPDEAQVYYIDDTDGALYRFNDTAQAYRPFDWRSGIFHFSTPVNFGAALVQGSLLGSQAGNFNFEVFAVGRDDPMGESTELNKIFRVKPGRYREWYVRLRGVGKIESVDLASGPEEFALG